tara:strand:+ start:2403 stop:3662 length:1260 start_codon:yes stop_codon:yes gene_type:complete
MILYLLGMISYFLIRIAKGKNKFLEVLIAAAYVTGIEVFLRMTKAYFLYETGKYLVILFIVVGLFYDGFKMKAYLYLLFILALIPGVLITYDTISYDENFRMSILFNLSGPLTLFFVALYTYGKKITYKDFLKILNFLVFPLIAMTVYIFLYNPDLRDIITNTAASSAASGGYGPNQVSTVLGLGVFVLFARLFIPYHKKLIQFLMMFILAAMTYRGILTFSRGGVLVAGIMMVVFLISFFLFTNLKSKVNSVFKIVGVFGVLFFIWTMSLIQSGGLIENRYTNKDALGREKDDFTSGREEIINTELTAFFEHPFLGVGVGSMKSIRLEETGIAAATHNEVSRMLSEHGLFGIFALLILLIVPIANNPLGLKNIYFYPFLLFWLLTISHSAMRIAAPAFIYGLGLITITREKKNTLHRK